MTREVHSEVVEVTVFEARHRSGLEQLQRLGRRSLDFERKQEELSRKLSRK
jgi:hypothetical protein